MAQRVLSKAAAPHPAGAALGGGAAGSGAMTSLVGDAAAAHLAAAAAAASAAAAAAPPVAAPPVGGDAAQAAAAAAQLAAAQAAAAASGNVQIPPQIQQPNLAALLGGGVLGGTAANVQHFEAALRDEDTRRMLLQLDARTRAAERILFSSVTVPTSHLGVVAGLGALRQYNVLTKAKPTDHGLGGSEGMVGAAFLSGTCCVELPPTVDLAVKQKYAAILLLTSKVMGMGPTAAQEFIEHFVVVELSGRMQGQALVAFAIKGTFTLPLDDAEVTLCINEAKNAVLTNNFTSLTALASQSFEMEDGMPVACSKPRPIQRTLLSLLASTGGTVPSGKAPRSAAARKIKGKGKGKNK